MPFWINLLVVVITCGFVGTVLVLRRLSHWDSRFKLVASLLPAGLLLVVLSWIYHILASTYFDWNQARLAPLFGLLHGYSLYYVAETGPIMGAVYGPISYLAYFPSLLAHSVIPALVIGSLTSSVYFMAPAIWVFVSEPFHQREGRAVGLFLFMIFAFWVMGDFALHYCSFNIHADAPALGFGAMACVFLMKPAAERQPLRVLVLSALFIVLAIFSKQSLLFLAPVAAFFIWVTDGKKSAVQFIAMFAVLSVLTFGLFSSFFSAHSLYFNLYTFVSREGFGDDGYMQSPQQGSVLKSFIHAGQGLLEHEGWIIVLLAICYVIEFYTRHAAKWSPREWLRQNRWAVFHFAALGGLPFALIFKAKVGGGENAFGLSLYFGVIGLLLFAGHLSLRWASNGDLVILGCLIIAAAVLSRAMIYLEVSRLFLNRGTSRTEQVYEYEKRNPGEIYFSFFPLPVLMVEGRMYHFEYGLFDRELGGARVSQAHFMKYIPEHPKYVQRTSQNSPVSEYLPQFACPNAQPPIPELSFYGKCATDNGFK